MKYTFPVIVWISLLSGCANPSTPAGHEGYVQQGAVVGVERFYDVQEGPTSTGVGWLLSVQNVDYRWATYSEDFNVMSFDNLSLSFHAHVVMKPRKNTVRQIVELYGGDRWYIRNLQQPFRNAVYEAVAGYKALEAKDNREQIGKVVNSQFAAYLVDKPFEIQKVVIGMINLPELVAKAQEAKINKETQLSQKVFEIAIAKQDATVRIEEARGIAESQRIINATLTPLYLQHEAIKAQMMSVGSPNHTTVYIPVGTNGLPLVKVIE